MGSTAHRGDLLFVTNWEDPYRVGEIVMFRIKGKNTPIVHRLTRVYEREGLKFELLTKGDDNPVLKKLTLN